MGMIGLKLMEWQKNAEAYIGVYLVLRDVFWFQQRLI